MYTLPTDLPASLALIQASVGADDAARLEQAYRFAEAAHNGQTRDEGTPFIEHPVRVATILWNELGQRDDVDLIIAALCHDTVEDSEDVEPELLESFFGPAIASMVLDVTKPPAAPGEKEARDRAYLDKLPKLSMRSRLLKLADRIDNLRAVVHSREPGKAQRYLTVSRQEFIPLALQTDPVAARLVIEACDNLERHLQTRAGAANGPAISG